MNATPWWVPGGAPSAIAVRADITDRYNIKAYLGPLPGQTLTQANIDTFNQNVFNDDIVDAEIVEDRFGWNAVNIGLPRRTTAVRFYLAP